MQLLNVQFAILLIKVAISVLPGVFGLFLLFRGEEAKRGMRNKFCSRLFGVSNAIAYPKFARMLIIVGVLSLLFCGMVTWFLLLRGFF